MAGRKLNIRLTKDTPYLTLMGELWGVFCEDFGENDRVITAPLCTIIFVISIAVGKYGDVHPVPPSHINIFYLCCSFSHILLIFLVDSIPIVYCIPCYETVSSWATLSSALLDQNVEQYWLTRMGVKCQTSQYKDPTKDGYLLALPIQDTVRVLLHIALSRVGENNKVIATFVLLNWYDIYIF